MLDIEHENEIIGENLKILKSTSQKRPKGVVVHLHGFPGGPLEDFRSLHNLLAARGYTCISFNYPGLWQSAGKFSLDNAFEAANSVLEHIREGYKDTPIYIYGESFGGFIALVSLAEMENPPTKIAMRAPLPGLALFDPEKNPQKYQQFVASVSMMTQGQVLNLDPDVGTEIFMSENRRFDIDDALKRYVDKGGAIYIVVGRNDEILPFAEIEKTYGKYAELDIYDDLSHNNISRTRMVEILTKFDIFYKKDD